MPDRIDIVHTYRIQRETTTRIPAVDYDPAILDALKVGLGSKDVEVDTAKNGAGAIMLGSLKQYDGLIADLCLPDMHGLALIGEIKRRTPDIVSIVITGNPVDEGLMRAIGCGLKN